MQTASDPYEDAALTYTRLVRKECEEAANTIEHIRTDFGAHAALPAALVIMIMKMEVQQNQSLPSTGLYAHLFEDYPDALPLTNDAMNCCLLGWGLPLREREPSEWMTLAIV